jgi:hypothetical protein
MAPAGTEQPTTEATISGRSVRATELFLHQSSEAARHRAWARAAICALLLALAVAALYRFGPSIRWTKARGGDPKYVWAQMLPENLGGGRLVRAIVAAGERCPRLVENGKSSEMSERAGRVRAAFPISICEARIGAGSEAWVANLRLPARPADPRDVVVLGDSGCRMVHYDRRNNPQSCLSGVEWPFAAVAASAAKAVGSAPAVVIHVGDYHYGENPCADESTACGGSPFGDNWATWEEEFFKPARPLLRAAPWVMVRGNHENCARAGAGWIYLFGLPGQETTTDACEHDLEPYSLAFGETATGGNRVLKVFDTANEDDEYTLAERCTTYRRWIDELADAKVSMWLALHHPLWSRSPGGLQETASPDDRDCENKERKTALTAVRARFTRPQAKPPVRLVLAGHIHLAQVFEPNGAEVPTELIAGNGGTKLDPLKPREGSAPGPGGAGYADGKVSSFGVEGSAFTVAEFGFMRMHRDAAVWTVKLVGVHGNTIASCRITELPDLTSTAPRTLDCSAR